jgi:arylsulfatase A-like enzyme
MLAWRHPRRPTAPARRCLEGLVLGFALGGCALGPATAVAAAEPLRRYPDVLLVTVDTLRSDRLSSYGYERPTSPAIDSLLANGARFTRAYTVEPLTGPALCSLLTSRAPHEHGATRNGLAMRPGMPSLPKLLARGGYSTAAFVGNWTLRDKLTGLAEHFQLYEEVFSRRRWMGLFTREATGRDLTEAAITWLERYREAERRRPFLLWVHYVEPHAPYRLQREFAARLGIPLAEAVPRRDRYDSEVAFVDAEIGRLAAAVERLSGRDVLVVFASDHGENLGEHGDWGHGRNVYEPNLAIPMGIAWEGRIAPGRTVATPALITDLAPTVLGLLGLSAVDAFGGYDWSRVLQEKAAPPGDRITTFQAHRGAVMGHGDGRQARESGLLEVAILADGKKEVLRLKPRSRRLHALAEDPGEVSSLVPPTSEPSARLLAWLAQVEEGLKAARDLPAADLDPESIERLKALGYIE